MALGVRIAKRGMRGRFEDAQVVAFPYHIQGQKSDITVIERVPARQDQILNDHGEVSGLLCHPGAVRLRRTASNPYPAAAQMQKKQHVEGD